MRDVRHDGENAHAYIYIYTTLSTLYETDELIKPRTRDRDTTDWLNCRRLGIYGAICN